MRILEAHVDPISGHSYAVIVNPIAGGLAGQPAYRYRLICASQKDWVRAANTLRSVSRTPGILIYETFDVLHDYNELPDTRHRILALRQKSRLLGGVAYREQLLSRQS